MPQSALSPLIFFTVTTPMNNRSSNINKKRGQIHPSQKENINAKQRENMLN